MRDPFSTSSEEQGQRRELPLLFHLYRIRVKDDQVIKFFISLPFRLQNFVVSTSSHHMQTLI